MARLSRKLARTLFHAMAGNGPKLERRQLLLGRLVDIGAELFAISSAAAYAHSKGDKESIQTARYVCQRGKRRVEALFADAARSPDKSAYRLAKTMLESA